MKSRTEHLLSLPKTEDVVAEIIELNIGLMKAQLSRFYLHDDPDALSFAYEAFWKAIVTFDASRNNMFSTYATVCMYNRLGSYIRSLHNQAVEVVYYEESVSEGGPALLNVIDSGYRTDHGYLLKEHIVVVKDVVEVLARDITNELQRRIVKEWMNSDFSMTHENIAMNIGCTQSYVSQVLKKFSIKVKYKLGELAHV
jgi:DNA-directed RNA polymerase specialized sigma subunit